MNGPDESSVRQTSMTLHSTEQPCPATTTLPGISDQELRCGRAEGHLGAHVRCLYDHAHWRDIRIEWMDA